MIWKVLIAHADGEEGLAEELARPLRNAGYEVAHQGTVLVGESIAEEASKVLSLDGPVILCATVRAIGTGLSNRLVSAARLDVKKRVFVMQMEKEAYVDEVTFGEKIARYWQDRAKAMDDLLSALKRYFPLDDEKVQVQQCNEAEQRYCDLLLASCDIVNLANLPEDRIIAQQPFALRRLYVPLSVRVEVETGDKIEWEELEKRRLELMRGNIDLKEISRENKSLSFGERLVKSQRLVVLGDPGSGKTTLARWISTAYLLRRKRDSAWKDLPDVKTLPDFDLIPIIIRCRDLKEDCLDGSLDDILRHTLRKAELASAEADALQIVLCRRLYEGTALLIIDGLDEIADPSIRSRFCQQLENIHIAYPNAPIIVTSRIVGYREMGYRLGRGFEHVMLADFTPKEKDDFASRWCELTELPENRAKATEDLIHDIHSSDRIERMTGNPMMLTTLALVRRKVGKLPNRRADLYWEAVQVLLNWRSDVDKPIDTNEAVPQLEYVAYDMCNRGVQQIRRDKILELIARMRNEYPNLHQTRNSTPEDFLARLEARTGLIVEAGRIHDLGMDIPLYEFRHLTFQEYLAARALVDGCFPGRDVNRSLANYVAPLAGCITTEEPLAKEGIKEVAVVENWREALRLCTAICSNDDVDSVLLAILTPIEGEAVGASRARSILAMLCLADEPNVSETTVNDVIQTFAGNIEKDDGGSRVRTSADKAAFEVAGTRWASNLSAALAREYCRRKDIDRYEVGSLCGMVCTSNAQIAGISTEDLLQRLTRNLSNGDEQEVIRSALAVMRLAHEKEVNITPSLTDELIRRIDGSEPQAQASVWALAWLACGTGSYLSFPGYANSNSPWKKPVLLLEVELILNNVRMKPNRKSWWPMSKDIQHISSILMNSYTNQEVLRFILWIIEYKRIFFKVESLTNLLNHPNPIVRANFIETLETITSEDAMAPIISSSGVNMRGAIASALGSISSERAIDLIIPRLNDSDANVRRAAASALGSTKSERVIDPLISILDDSNPNVRRAVAYALGSIDNEHVINPLISILNDSQASVRKAAAFALSTACALGSIKGERAIGPLIARLGDSDLNVRVAAAYALGSIKDEHAIDPLIARLDDSDANVRRAAASALGSIKGERAIDPLIARLDDSDANVRRAAASALGEINNECTIDPLIARLDDSDANVRVAAVSALGSIKSECAVDPLIARLGDSDANVRVAAVSALGSIKSECAVDPLIARLGDSDANVRAAAVSALGSIKSERAIDPLIARLGDSDANVPVAAASSLGEISNERAIDPLMAGLNDSDANVRRAAASALGSIKSERAIDPLIARLDDLDANVRRAAASALGKIKNEHLIELTTSRLNDSDANVRRAAASTLGFIKSEHSIDLLISRLGDSDANVREAAASALGEISNERAIDPLIARLDDSDANVRGAAASSLGEISNERATDPLIARLNDSDANVRRAVVYALGAIKSENAISPLIPRLDDLDSNVRRAAAYSLSAFSSLNAIQQDLNTLQVLIRRASNEDAISQHPSEAAERNPSSHWTLSFSY